MEVKVFYKGVKIVQHSEHRYYVRRFNDPIPGDAMFTDLAGACLYIDGHLEPSRDLKGIIEQVKDIARSLDKLSENMKAEARVYGEELAERQRLGLKGEAAVNHYNDYMRRHNMEHLCIE